MKRSVAVIFLIVIETLRKNSAFDASDSTYSDLSGDLNVLPKVYCTKNERECQELQTCQPFKPYMCLEDPGCGQWCYSVECNPNPCPHGQSCVNIWYLDDLEQPVDRCYCPPGLVPAVNGTCVEAPSKCSAALKDRYCDNDCKLGPNSTVTCTCPSGLTLEHRKLGKFEFVEYGVCIPADDDEFGARKVVINGEENSELMPDDGYITLNSPTAVDRVQIRPTKESIQQIYAVKITDFAMDWPTGNVYYTSTCEPHLTVCNIDGTACRILPASTLLEDPKEMLIDSDLGYLLVSDAKKIWKISLNGSKTQSLELVSGAKRLALDHHNKYLYYLLIRDRSVYRINYQIFDKIPQKLMWLQNAKSIGEITSMTSIGRELYMAEYKAENNTSYLYHLNSSNPFYMGNLTMLLRLPGRLKDVLVYHKSLVNIGPTLTTSTMNCHLVLQGSCTCMEGYELNKEGRCVQVDIRISKKDVLLYNSQSRRLVQGIFASDTMRCPSSALTTIPINPVTLPDYVTSNSDVHIGYDPVDNMLYISDEVTISNASAAGTGYVARLTDTGWRARGGTIIYGLAINPSVRTLFYAEYSRIHYNIIAVSLDNREIRASYISSPTIGHRYFSTGLSLDRSSFEFRIFDLQNSLSTPIIHGVSMLHARSIDPKTGDFFDIGFGEKTTLGYSYLPPGANSSMARVNVDIGHPLNALSMGNHSILHFSSTMKRYGMVNTSNPSQVMLCDTFKLRYNTEEKRQLAEMLTKSLKAQRQVLTQSREVDIANTMVSFEIAKILTKHQKPFSDGEIVKECLLKLAEVKCSQMLKSVSDVSLSRITIVRRVEDMGSDIAYQLKVKLSDIECYSLAFDESTDIRETAQPAVFIRAVDKNFNDYTRDLQFYEQSLREEKVDHCPTVKSVFNGNNEILDSYAQRVAVLREEISSRFTEFRSFRKRDQFVCPGTSICLERTKLCDGVEDCEGQEDEQFYTYCPVEEVTCSDSYVQCNETKSELECIRKDSVCDGVPDCSNGEDEEHCDSSCSFFTCPMSGICYGLRLCDGVSDCPEYSTEHDVCSSCHPTAYKCPTTKSCISKIALCDGISDCPDGADEQNCTGHMSAGSCGVDEKTCDSGQCIPEIWWCDQTHDCIDRSDESSCETVTCSDGFVKCNNTGHCIPLSWRCDMHRDCLDGEDESNCEHHCPDSEYYCAGTETDLCISKSQLCNSLSDCDNGMDESLHCDSEACDSALCSHECVVDPVTGDAMCLCPRGMELANNTCIEIRRACGQWGVCSQECTSLLDDRFKCTCHEDYLIESDLYSCTHKERPVSLIFSNRHELRLLSAEPGTLYSTLISSLRNTIALDYHWEKHYVFWSDVITDKIYRGTREPDSSSNSLVDIRVVVTNGLPTAEGLAVDWIGDHIYWVESGLDIIEVADLEGNNRATIITHSDTNPMENPRSIAVDPRVGLLFWADWGIRQIRRASMAGKDAKMLFLVNDPNYIPDGGWANGLTLDYDTRRVYWNDAKSDSIQTVDYNGEHFHLVLEKNDLLMHPFAISVFENWVYWSDWRRNSINRANKWNGTSAEIVQSTVTQPFDLKVYHVGRQPPVHVDSANMCGIDNGNCSHLCLSDGLKAHCACPHLLKLALDKRTCQEINSFLLLASSRLLTSISLSSDDYGVIPTLAAPIVDSVYIADYYMVDGDDEQRLFWADSGLNTISTATIDGSNPTNIIHLPIAVEYGFAVDYIYKRLYITTFSLRTSSSPGGIDVCAFDGSRRVTITSSLVMPTRISLQPSNGTMFVIDEGTGAIYHMYMNGSHLSANGTRNNILEGSSYRFDNIRDMNLVLSSDNHLRSRLYFGNRTHIFCYDGRRISLLTDKLVERWTVWEDDLYFTVAFDNQSLPSGYDIKKIALSAPLSSARKVGAVKGQLPLFMRLVEAHMTASGEERVKCLDCNHYCLPPVDPSTDYGTCVCYASYRYENSSCRAISPMLLYATRDHGLGAVELSSQGWAVNSANVLPVISQVNRPNALYYYSSCTQPGSDYIYWIDSGHSIVRSNRDLTERKTIVSGLIAAKDLAIDPQGGNMYWIDSFTGTVQVCQTDGAHCLILAQLDKEGDNQLVSLALHVSKGYLFYLESARGITKMRLGNNRTAEFIGSSPLIGASAMAVDIVGDRLFVCDGLHQITSMDLDGSHRTAYSISLDNKNCSSIAVQGGFVYYVLHRSVSCIIYLQFFDMFWVD
ncbi:prolow-density lipoprotein receptor-related protein 1-like [Watersipora subatra]|uniref:prolow-density lipoprotein receptor-related protein 1-like n=1 Tax=Watersipora subatra TaxID=2589382 RepID=UPI00355B8510